MTVDHYNVNIHKNYITMSIFLLFFQSVFFYPIHSENAVKNSASGFDLEIKIVNIKNNSGQIALRLLDGKKGIVTQQFVSINNKTSTLTIKDLSKGKYAVQIYHDENRNGKLDFNFLGIPKEGYGFSNDARGFMSEPAFEKQLFPHDKDQMIQIKLSY